MHMKNGLIISIVAALLLSSIAPVMAVSSSPVQTGSTYVAVDQTSLHATLLNQDPVSAEPGSYANLLFKLENWGTQEMDNAAFTLVQAFPFTLDPGANATAQLGTVGSLAVGSTSYFVKYKVKVDENAVGGENQVKILFGNDTMLSQQTFNVSVSDPRTDFDVLTQGSSSAASTTALASTNLVVANIGDNTAFSTVVSIPDQAGFRVSGDYASIVGNLNAGDYTLVSFTVVPTNATADASTSQSGRRNLTVDVSYTDGLGIRRTAVKQVSIDVSGLSSGFAAGRTRTTTGSNGSFQLFGSTGLTYITIGVVGIVAIVLLFKFVGRKKKVKG